MPSLIYTLGDPAGLGPELLFLSSGLELFSRNNSLLVIGPESILEHHARLLGRSIFWQRTEDPGSIASSPCGIYLYEPSGLAGLRYNPGQGSSDTGFAAGISLKEACAILNKGLAQALVTGPLNKAFLQDAGFDFSGHTEFLADYFGLQPDKVCMHLCGKRLRVSLVTTHPPLRKVPELITKDRIVHCLKLTCEFTMNLGLTGPVAVCGLNPHAGEQGRIGNEESTLISPAIDEALKQGLNVNGPFPADTVFSRAMKGEFSAVLAMYHDQGLGPLKVVEFGSSVNITLGLPIVRTSVDHGTGYDLAGTGRADPGSLDRAFELALRLASNS
ncbi:4-hydroxythreonine-4-phosphate dehydrogenase PdxA [Desulfonatronovibrio hydrogenovorans]|uniref:4-hydroxythreonine-4-phosphate dehydrogenase PdxA n=1 Tax=Desulfonatronovibrio hydrogenovorans TaxID=53245 RepID=UPI0004921A0C|nr:4-hydroxythreonine-4-phosphate dehydrogenase PdxA [Desulfonatronovibrio hydrogenovorans]